MACYSRRCQRLGSLVHETAADVFGSGGPQFSPQCISPDSSCGHVSERAPRVQSRGLTPADQVLGQDTRGQRGSSEEDPRRSGARKGYMRPLTSRAGVSQRPPPGLSRMHRCWVKCPQHTPHVCGVGGKHSTKTRPARRGVGLVLCICSHTQPHGA